MAEQPTAPFDLVEQPWILVHTLDGKVEEVSLRDLFARSHQLRSVLGELPTQTFAIVRLLLAVLHRAAEGPQGTSAWRALWQASELPAADISAYLDTVRSRFDLLSTITPFYQVADLRSATGGFSGLDKLIADVPVNAYFFTTRLKSGIDRLSFAEAARWVVHCQAFDPSGIKSGAVGDERVKGGKGYPIGTGWAGMLGGVMAEGDNLRETLLLNLIPEDELDLSEIASDLPVWEREPLTARAEYPEGYQPVGPLQVYTWQSRRIRLIHDHDGVYGVLISNGDKMAPQNQHTTETMSVWRRSQAQEKKSGVVPTYMPRAHDPELTIWRGLAAFLQNSRRYAQGKDAAAHLRPAVVDWLEKARGNGELNDDYHVRVRTIGMLYGSQSSTTAEVIDDAVSLSVALLGESGHELRATAIDAVDDADAGAQALGNLAANLAAAAGGDGGGPRDRARELAYAELDHPFRTWLTDLQPGTDPTDARRAWHATADGIVRRLGRDLVEQAGPAAWQGREVRGRHVSTPEADGWFRGQLRRTYTFAYPTDQRTEVPV